MVTSKDKPKGKVGTKESVKVPSPKVPKTPLPPPAPAAPMPSNED